MGRSENYWADKYKGINKHGKIIDDIGCGIYYVFPLYEDSNIFIDFIENYDVIELQEG